jgi:hypothetical protein
MRAWQLAGCRVYMWSNRVVVGREHDSFMQLSWSMFQFYTTESSSACKAQLPAVTPFLVDMEDADAVSLLLLLLLLQFWWLQGSLVCL